MPRSLLFVPGNRPDMLEKSQGLNPDAFVPDMEDSVPAAEKRSARRCVADHIGALAETGRFVLPRVNGLRSGLIEEDLKAVVSPSIVGVSVGKIDSASDIAEIDEMISSLEVAAGMEGGSVSIVAWLETASGVVGAAEICRSSERLTAVAYGAEDLSRDMEIMRHVDGEDNPLLTLAAGSIALSARAAGIAALDTPFFGFRDPAGLRRDCFRARAAGFAGKFAIHPAQIDVINESFSPSPQEVERAHREVEAFEAAEREGRGATSLDGQVIDVPVAERARRLLRRHQSLNSGEGQDG